jgi:hypothetical protein
MRKLAKSKSGKLLVIIISATLTLILPGIELQNAKAAGGSNLRKELVIPAGATSRLDFSAGKNEPMSIATSGRSQKTASGFNGYCKIYLSNGEYAYDYVAFANDQSKGIVFTSSVGGSYFLNCENSSTQEDAVILVTVDSFASISNSSSGNMKIPALETALVSFNAIKNTPIFISNLGNAKTSAKDFAGFCNLYDNAGSYTYESFTFSIDSGHSFAYLPKYSGTYVLQCFNRSDEVASFNLSLYSASSLRPGSVTSISATAHGSAAFKFSAEKGLPLSISTKGNAKSTPTGFIGHCGIYDSNGFNDVFDYVNFGSDQVGSNVVTPKYSGDYYLFCNNQSNEAAMFQIFGLRDLIQMEPTASFKTTSASSDSPSASATILPAPSSTPKPSPIASKTSAAAPECPLNRAPKRIPAISITAHGLFVTYDEPGYSDKPGCIDGFRIYASTVNPVTKVVTDSNGTYSVSVKDCQHNSIGQMSKSAISCAITNTEPWFRNFGSQSGSYKTLAFNASAVGGGGESSFSPYVYLFQQQSALVTAACVAMQGAFATHSISSTSAGYIVGIAAGAIGAGVITFFTGGATAPFLVGAAVAVTSDLAARQITTRFYASIDGKAAIKFVNRYPVAAVHVLEMMPTSPQRDVLFNAIKRQPAFEFLGTDGQIPTAADLDLMVVDKKVTKMYEAEKSTFERNGASEVSSLTKGKSTISLNIVKVAKIGLTGVDSVLKVIDQSKNDKTAILLPSNCQYDN